MVERIARDCPWWDVQAPMIVAALHDAVEDTPLTVAMIAKLFGKDIADAEAPITRMKTENYLSDYIARVAEN